MLGTSLTTWAAQVHEMYKRAQQGLVRAARLGGRNLGAMMAGGMLINGIDVAGVVGRVGGIVKGAMTPMAMTLLAMR